LSTVDDRVVSASFETSKFQQGVQTVLNGLDRLKKALHFPGAGKGLEEINAQAGKMNLSHISGALDTIKNRFTALNVVALQVLSNIATKALGMAANFVKGFSVSPIVAGLHEYETNLNSVQTILANTEASGAKLKDVNAALDELNAYSDKTIYNFSEMAKNIGTFTAAGVDLKTSTQSIKGIANLAALSGSNSEQASSAMYQLSQAIASGKVGLQDWNSVVNAGMGGTVFQRALATTATKMGTLSEGAVQLKGKMKNVSIEGQSFRDSVAAKPGEKSWLTSDVLTQTLKQFTGDLSDAELKAQGFSDAQIEAIQKTAKTAQKAATEVKTLSGVLDVARESAGSGWAKTWQIIFGDFGEAKELFTGVSTAISGFITASADARNKVLGDWKELGGRTVLLRTIKVVFNDISKVAEQVKAAFREVFPAKTGKDLFNATKAFREFVKVLTPSPETLKLLNHTFTGLFAAIDIGIQVVKGLWHFMGNLIGLIPKGNGNFLEFTATIGDWLLHLDRSLKKGDKVNEFFDKLTGYIKKPIGPLKDLAETVISFFEGFTKTDTGVVAQGLGDMTQKLSPMQRIINVVTGAWDRFMEVLHNIGDELQPVIDAIGEAFGSLGSAIADTFTGGNFGNVMDALKVGLLGGILVTIRNFFKKDLGESFFGKITGSFTDAMDALTGKMQAMQTNLKADTLMKIAIAIGILAASIVALSLIDADKLNQALSAMAIGFGQLLGAMAILTNVSKSAGFAKVPFIAAALILLAVAIDLLVIAVIALSKLEWKELAKGLGGVAGLLLAISVAVGPLSKNSGGMIQAGLGILAIAFAMKVLADAVKDFGNMSWTEIGKGLTAVAVALGAIGLASKLFPTGMVSIGVGLIAVAVGLKLLVGAVQTFGDMKWSTIGKGLLTIAAALVIIGLAMGLMPPNMVVTAAGLVLVAFALKGIAEVIKSFGDTPIGELAKGIGALAASLIVLGLALYGMSASMPGALALAVASASLILLATAMEKFSKVSWGGILKGLVALGGALIVLGLASVALAPIAPALLAMGAALLLIGGAIFLTGAGIALLGTGLSAIAVAGPAAILILLKAFEQVVTAIPRFVEGVIMGLLRIVDKVAEVAPKFLKAFVAILKTALQAVIVVAPMLAIALGVLIQNAIKVLVENVPKMIDAGLKLLMALLSGIKNNISKVTQMVADIVIKFLDTLKGKLPQLITAGANFLSKLLEGIANNIRKVVTKAGDVVKNFIKGMGDNYRKIITAGGEFVGKVLEGIGSAYAKIIEGGGKMIGKLLEGIGKTGADIVKKAVWVAGKFMDTIGKELVKLADKGATAIIDFLNGIADVIRNREPEMLRAGGNIADAIIDGFVAGINAGDIVSSITNKFKGAIKAAKHAVGAKSPSTVFKEIGDFVMQGFALGINENDDAKKSMEAMSYGLIESVKSIFQITSPSKVMKELGRYIGEGFVEGLQGTEEDITNSVKTLDEKLVDMMDDASDTIKEENDKLHDLLKEKHKDWDAIHDAQDVVKENQKILKLSTAAHLELTKGLSGEATRLRGLAKQYDAVAIALDEAKNKLDAAKAAREDALKGYSDQFAETPDITQSTEDEKHDPLAEYIKGLQARGEAVRRYGATLAELRRLGLDDKTYKKLLQDGTADQEFADQLLAGGAAAIAGINALDANLDAAAGSLATNASESLYRAGQTAAESLVKSLEDSKSTIVKTMEDIATAMVKALKKKLKMKSPSKVFIEIGEFVTEGLAQGITATTKSVANAAEGLAGVAVDSMKQSFADLTMNIIGTDPTITPVLDLSQIQADAKNMSDMLNVVPITAAASYNQAAAISADQNTVQTALDETASTEASVIKFEQNNYSPTALSEADIYRQTKNQLSQAKAALP
jgi:tape measure domain-containing protein